MDVTIFWLDVHLLFMTVLWNIAPAEDTAHIVNDMNATFMTWWPLLCHTKEVHLPPFDKSWGLPHWAKSTVVFVSIHGNDAFYFHKWTNRNDLKWLPFTELPTFTLILTLTAAYTEEHLFLLLFTEIIWNVCSTVYEYVILEFRN